MNDTQKVRASAEPHDENARIVTFDLMPREPDYYFVLTEALRDFAARQCSEAADYEGADAEARTRWDRGGPEHPPFPGTSSGDSRALEAS